MNSDNERTKDEFWKKCTIFWINALMVKKKTHDFDDIKWIVGNKFKTVEIGLSGNPRMNESNYCFGIWLKKDVCFKYMV